MIQRPSGLRIALDDALPAKDRKRRPKSLGRNEQVKSDSESICGRQVNSGPARVGRDREGAEVVGRTPASGKPQIGPRSAASTVATLRRASHRSSTGVSSWQY